LTQNISLIMYWSQLNSFLLRMRLLFKNKYLSFIWTIRPYTSKNRHSKNCTNAGHSRSSSGPFIGFYSVGLFLFEYIK
jgi:hypothetical protein